MAFGIAAVFAILGTLYLRLQLSMYRPNVSMITYRASDGRFLIVRKPREKHAWQFPQGGVDEGEEYEQAARRELKEEVGTDKFEGFFKSKHVYFYEFPPGYDREGKYTGHKQSYFFVQFTGEEEDIHLDKEELEEHRWVYQNELEQYLESPEYLKKVNQVIYEFRDQIAQPDSDSAPEPSSIF